MAVKAFGRKVAEVLRWWGLVSWLVVAALGWLAVSVLWLGISDKPADLVSSVGSEGPLRAFALLLYVTVLAAFAAVALRKEVFSQRLRVLSVVVVAPAIIHASRRMFPIVMGERPVAFLLACLYLIGMSVAIPLHIWSPPSPTNQQDKDNPKPNKDDDKQIKQDGESGKGEGE
jgi:hypothetical protein